MRSNEDTTMGEETEVGSEDSGIKEKEIYEALDRMKKKKAPGIGSIPMKAWIYDGTVVIKGLVELLQLIWNKGDIPRDWRIDIITPIFEKGDANKTENYRRISLLCTAYRYMQS